eukprot:TRINITY_DN7544_c0_g1_i1.p1 TRINITY_DN7544_c0_g1~~TRINITY_DN7544_c0_g1_i1.p1  ORF type:complete len:1034 (-),score=165.34 TRINITY_DN7544_c0_g1_i1:74-3175(-)
MASWCLLLCLAAAKTSASNPELALSCSGQDRHACLSRGQTLLQRNSDTKVSEHFLVPSTPDNTADKKLNNSTSLAGSAAANAAGTKPRRRPTVAKNRTRAVAKMMDYLRKLRKRLKASQDEHETEARKVCHAIGPPTAFVRFIRPKARKHHSADDSSGGYGAAHGGASESKGVLADSIESSTPGVLQSRNRSNRTHRGEGGNATYPFATAELDLLVLDLTNAFAKTDKISILVTAVTETGTYIDEVGFTETYGDNIGKYFEMRLDRIRSQIEVYSPQMSLRTSDFQSEEAVKRGGGDGWIDVLPLLRCPATADAKRVVVDASILVAKGFFVANVGQATNFKLLRTKPYPTNFDITVEYLGLTSMNIGFSVVLLPMVPMVPRVADDRLLYLATDYTDIGFHQALPMREAVDRPTSLIWRWDLSKLENSSIKIYIDPTVPMRWRQSFKEGVEAWNAAFTLVGQKASVMAVLPGTRDWPADYDIADARFSAISWSVTDQIVSMGQAKVDPRSGQIIKADITMSDKWVFEFLQELNLDEITPSKDASMSAALLELVTRGSQKSRNGARESHAESMSAGFSLLLRERMQQPKPFPKTELEEILKAGLRNVVMHETGHILGLRHNFKGSLAATKDCLQDMACTAREGIGSSVMDYVPINLPRPGGKEVHAFSPVIGAYDKLAIRYGYAPTGTGLEDILGEAEAFETCYDEDSEMGEDPLCAMYDLGEDPVDFFEEQLATLARVQKDMLSQAVLPDRSFASYGEAVHSTLRRALHMGFGLIPFLGGIRNRHAHSARNRSRLEQHSWARKPVPVDMQRQALQLLLKLLRPDQAGLLPQDGDLPFLLEGPRDGQYLHSLDLQDKMETLSSQLLGNILAVERLEQVRHQEDLLGSRSVPSALSVAEFLRSLGDGLLSGLKHADNGSQTSLEMHLQRNFVSGLVGLYQNASLPADLAAEVLVELHAAQATSLDAAEAASTVELQAHLALLNRDLSEVFCLTADGCISPRVPFESISRAPKKSGSRRESRLAIIALAITVLVQLW